MNRKQVIQMVSPKRLSEIIGQRTPCGRFLTRDGGIWVAVDNSTGDVWTEEFPRMRQAVQWLYGEFEVDEPLEQPKRKSRYAGQL